MELRSSAPPAETVMAVPARPRWLLEPTRTVPPAMSRPLLNVAVPVGWARRGLVRVTAPLSTVSMRVPGAMPVPETTMPARSPVVLATLSNESPALLPATTVVLASLPKVFVAVRTRRPAPLLTRPRPAVLLMTPVMFSWLPVTATAGSLKAPEMVVRPVPDIVRLPAPCTVVAMVAVELVLMSSVPPARVSDLFAGIEIGPRRVPPVMMYSVALTEPPPAMAKTPPWTVSLPELVSEAALRTPPELTTPEAMMPPAMVALAAFVNDPTEVSDDAVRLPPARVMTEAESGPVSRSEPVEFTAPVTFTASAATTPPLLFKAPVTARSLPGRRRSWPAESRVRPKVPVSGAFRMAPLSEVSPRVKAVAPAPSREPPSLTVVPVVADREADAASEAPSSIVTVSKLTLPERAAPSVSTTSAALPPIWLATISSFLERRKVVPASKVTVPPPSVPRLARARVPSATLMPPVKASGASMVRMPAPVLMKPSCPLRLVMASMPLADPEVVTSMTKSGLVGT